jgi:hypothetical protein
MICSIFRGPLSADICLRKYNEAIVKSSSRINFLLFSIFSGAFSLFWRFEAQNRTSNVEKNRQPALPEKNFKKPY